MRVLRFLCVSPSCPKVTFALQEDGLTSRYCRRSVPLTAMLTGFGLELAGRAGARLASRLGIAVHSSTILRLVAALPEREAGAAPGILGIDDFALRKGHVYGTVLVSMETGDVVDLLPDREAATVETWLKAHPGAAVICRTGPARMPRAPGPGRRARSRLPTAGICGTTWRNTRRRRRAATAAACSRQVTGQRPATTGKEKEKRRRVSPARNRMTRSSRTGSWTRAAGSAGS